MARKVYKARSLPLRGSIRGGRADENARPSRRRRAGKTDAEHERLRAREKGGEDSAIAECGGDRPAVEEPKAGASRRLSHRAEAAEAHTGSIKAQKHRRRLRHSAEETRSISRTEETFGTFGGNGAGERTAKPGRQTAGDPAGRGRAAQVESGNARKQRQRKQAGSFRQAEKDASAAAESFEKITDTEIKRTSEIASFQKRARLNHSDEESAMAHGAGRLARKTASMMGAAAMQAAKRRRSEAEEDNAAVEAVHSGTAAVYNAARYRSPSSKTAANSKRAASLHKNTIRSEENVRSEFMKSSEHAAQAEHRKKERILSFQKKKRQRAIAENKRKGSTIVTAGGFAASPNSMFTAPKKAKEAAKSFFSEHKGAILGICVAGLIFGLFALALSSGASLVQGSGTTVISTTYVSTDDDIYAAENAYCALEDGLNAQVNAIPSTHPGYDDYEYQIDEIEHNPYNLISYIQVKYGGFTYDDTVKAEISRLFQQQYAFSVSEKSETRTRMETVTEMQTVFDPSTGETRVEPVEYEREVEYQHRTLYTVLTNHSFDRVARANMTDEELILYNALNRTYGNRPYLFDLSSLSDGAGIQYKIPPEALSDEKFMNMLREAEKYLGMEYVWGGKSPRSGFDCSGFVCWVINHCGNGWDVGSKRAKDLCRMCIYVTPEEARPGDLIFFEKTYDTDGASHVGIYVGNNTMIHCGNPIKYGRIDTRYFKQHFLCFGRLPFYDN